VTALRIALAQGAIFEQTKTALAAAGLSTDVLAGGDRRLVLPAGDVEYVLCRPSDVPTYVSHGAADLGVTGKDVLMESEADVLELVDLGYGTCRFVVAAPQDSIDRSLDGRSLGRLVDVGTGTGRMIELFGPRAAQAIGIDRSSEMLRLARVKLDAAGVAGASLRQGDMYALPLGDRSVDSIILHQVLHYAHTPGSAITEAARVLRPGGRLLVIDFAQHDREELRNRDAHLRLGFADDAMRGWFRAAGLEVDRIDRLEGGEITVILWRGRKDGGAPRQRVAA